MKEETLVIAEWLTCLMHIPTSLMLDAQCFHTHALFLTCDAET